MEDTEDSLRRGPQRQGGRAVQRVRNLAGSAEPSELAFLGGFGGRLSVRLPPIEIAERLGTAAEGGICLSRTDHVALALAAEGRLNLLKAMNRP